jgi:glycerol-3-phosphate acyltransferase PlsY
MAVTDYYRQPTGNETSGFYEIFGYVGREATGGLFWPVMLFAIWIIVFLAVKQYSTSRAWTLASFFCAFLSIPLAVLNYIAPKWMYLSIFLTLIGFVWLKLETE